MTDIPAPMTPADCDLRDFAFMPLDVVRLLDSSLFARSTGDEFKASVALWCKSWGQVPCGSLPDDARDLAYLSGAGGRWNKVKAMALHGWIKCTDGRLYHPVVAEKALDAWDRKNKQRERSRKGNAARWGAAHEPHDPRPTAVQQGSAQGDIGDAYGVSAVSLKDVPRSPARNEQGLPIDPKGQGQGQGQGQEQEESALESLPLPREEPALANAESEPRVLPTAPMAVVGSLTAHLQGRARGQPFLTPKPNPRTVDEQLAKIGPQSSRSAPLTPEQLAAVRAQTRRRTA